MVMPVEDKNQVVERLYSAGPDIAALGVVGIGVFGSFATGKQNAVSDVDLLVEFAPEQHTFDNFMELSFLLEDLLGHRVELVTSESLSPHIGPHILSEVERVSIAARVCPSHAG